MSTKAGLKKAFKQFDTDGSGTLDAKEFLAILTRDGDDSMDADDAKDLLDMFDDNGDGVLQISEFIEAITSLEGSLEGEDEDEEDEDNQDQDDDGPPEPSAATAPKPSATPIASSGSAALAHKVEADGVTWIDPRGPAPVKFRIVDGMLAYEVLPGGEGPPPGLRERCAKVDLSVGDNDDGSSRFLVCMTGGDVP